MSNVMWPISYNITTLVGMLLFVFLTTPSFGSNITQHDDETQQQPKKRNLIMTSSEIQLPHDVRVYILSFLPQQKDLLRMGTVSRSWRKAAAKLWDNRTLDLSSKHLIEADYQALANGIFPRLRLNKVGLDKERMNILATGSHLQALELRGNNLRATESLTKLFSLSHLSHIDLYNNSIDNKGAKAIARVLTQNRTLTTIYLNLNEIGAAGAKAMAQMLMKNQTLTTVDLDGNSISDGGTKAIAEALTQNRTLATIYLSLNEIGAAGAKAMAQMLMKNQTLTTVDLSGNSISDGEAKAIAGALTQNKTLTTVNLYGNSIGNEGAKAIAEALSQNTTLTTVNLGDNKIGNEGKKALEDLKCSRPSLKLYY